MKILMLNYEYPPLGGGGGVCAKYQAEGLAKLGHEVTVITAWFEGEKIEERSGNLKIIRLKSKRQSKFKSNPIEMLSWIDKTKRFLNQHCQENKYNVAICHFVLPGGDIGRFLKNNFNIPYFVISHGEDIPWNNPSRMFKYHLLTFWWIKNILTASSINVLLSQQLKDNCDRFLGFKYNEKNIIIPNGCDTDIFKPDLGKKSKVFNIIFVGRLAEVKDPLTFLKAINLLSKSSNIDFQVTILGDGPIKKQMDDYVRINSLNNVVDLKGWVEKSEILSYYQLSHLQIMSSRFEAMSISALESLACGQYIISTPVSGNTDLIVEDINGEFFDFGDEKSLAEKINNFYKNKFLNNYKVDDNFLNEFRKKYYWDNIVKNYHDLLEQRL